MLYEKLANCTDPSFAFKFEDWVSYMDFTLNVKHKTWVPTFIHKSLALFLAN